ncbi:MAG: Smr/MutS family protein [Rhodospirillales bacterium]|nr:Smr/MutS family protein [Rhodospirillales bacterium]
MPAKDRNGDDEAPDRELWRRVTEGITPLKKREPAPPAPVGAVGREVHGRPSARAATPGQPDHASAAPLPPPPVRLSRAAPPELAPGVAPGIDKRTLARLRRGLIAPERRIDLHNMTQSEAHAALNRFLADAHGAGKRCVLVITGKGYRADGSVGVLRANVPHWLNQSGNRTRILAFSHAAPAHGGEGALYVLLRRQREER